MSVPNSAVRCVVSAFPERTPIVPRRLFRPLFHGVLLVLLLVSPPALAETLPDALVRAYQNNPQLNAERARQRATDENVPQALAGYRPQVAATLTSGLLAVRNLLPPGRRRCDAVRRRPGRSAPGPWPGRPQRRRSGARRGAGDLPASGRRCARTIGAGRGGGSIVARHARSGHGDRPARAPDA